MLHRAMMALGFSIPRDELQRRTYGETTEAAVRDFQEAYNKEDFHLIPSCHRVDQVGQWTRLRIGKLQRG
jgi:hypothetical protein